jgi:hypothetical protein
VLLLSLLLDTWWRLYMWCCPPNIVSNYAAAVDDIITLAQCHGVTQSLWQCQVNLIAWRHGFKSMQFLNQTLSQLKVPTYCRALISYLIFLVFTHTHIAKHAVSSV